MLIQCINILGVMMSATNSSMVNVWGNGLAIRLTKPVAKAAGFAKQTPIRITAQPGRIVIDVQTTRPCLNEMLAAFDAKRHGGEAMVFKPLGKERL